jgi:hypothetical protein
MANPAFSTRYKLPDGRIAVDVTEAKTLVAEDSGIVQNATTADVVITLPATATEGIWTVRDGGVKATNGPTGAVVAAAKPRVDPNSSDTIAGFNVTGTAADGKYMTCSAYGDEITIQNTGATNGGFVLSAVGDWTREG